MDSDGGESYLVPVAGFGEAAAMTAKATRAFDRNTDQVLFLSSKLH